MLLQRLRDELLEAFPSHSSGGLGSLEEVVRDLEGSLHRPHFPIFMARRQNYAADQTPNSRLRRFRLPSSGRGTAYPTIRSGSNPCESVESRPYQEILQDLR